MERTFAWLHTFRRVVTRFEKTAKLFDGFHAAGLLHDFEPGKREFIVGQAAMVINSERGSPGMP